MKVCYEHCGNFVMCDQRTLRSYLSLLHKKHSRLICARRPCYWHGIVLAGLQEKLYRQSVADVSDEMISI